MAVLSSSARVGASEVGVRRSALATPTVALAMAAAAALCFAVVIEPADAATGPVVCPFRLLTGLPCPSCGMTRAWVFVMHGQVSAAVAANPFVLVLLPAAAAIVLGVGLALLRRRPLPDLTRVLGSRVAHAVLVGWLVFALVRMVAVASG